MRAFISYSRLDKEFAYQLRDDLEKHNIPCWIDVDDIPQGKNWDDVVSRALREEDFSHFLFVCSHNSVNSDNVKDEIALALEKEIEYIIPVITDDALPPMRLIRRNRADFYRNGYEQELEKLTKEITTRPIQQQPATPKITPSRPPKEPTTQQTDAAHDTRPRVRLVAGPGTGKSFVIEERVRWLLSNDVRPDSIYVVSFTKAASYDLRLRIVDYCTRHEQPGAEKVSTTTLHSLALKVLRKSRQLREYPVYPQVMDRWELEEIFDLEFNEELKEKGIHGTPTRCGKIRSAYEAKWCTGSWEPDNYVKPIPPISEVERNEFTGFYVPTTQTYACLLPGEIVRKCVDGIEAGQINPKALLDVQHLIVDEYQDLNEVDQSFVHSIIRQGAITFIAGDDDQSVYAFRFASPRGIQDFTQTYPDAGKHELSICYRCTTRVLQSAQSLLNQHHARNRIAKSLTSHFSTLQPPIDGHVMRWSFPSGAAEAEAIAQSSKTLLEKGVKPREILILLSTTRTTLLTDLEKAFQKLQIPLELPRENSFSETDAGRFTLALIRVACDQKLEDWVAHRLILGLPEGVGVMTCKRIKDRVVDNGTLKYLELFYYPLPDGLFKGGELRALNRARALCERIREWQGGDALSQRKDEISDILTSAFQEEKFKGWFDAIATLPVDITLSELFVYLSAQTDEQRTTILETVYTRLGLSIPTEGLLPPRVRLMTMHGVKGLDGQVVFIPGLEEETLPQLKHKGYAGLELEDARLLYVSITRARAACIFTYATGRVINGEYKRRDSSRFTRHLDGTFLPKAKGFSLSELDAQTIAQTVVLLREKDTVPPITSH